VAQLAAALAVGAADQCFEAGRYLNQGERFAQIVIGAQAQPSTRWLSASRAVRISTGSWRPLSRHSRRISRPSMPGRVIRIAAS
jgi:hypothetical protein